jgi:protein TIF31
LTTEPRAINTSQSSKSWISLTPSALQTSITTEVRRRYRFVLPSSAFEQDVSKPRLLRELCLASGIQLALQTYTFEKAQSNGRADETPQQQQQQKKNKAEKNARSASPAPAVERSMTFTPDDILNVYPVIKKAPFKSSMAEDLLERGQLYFVRGNTELGEAFVGDALNMYDQIFGAVHPEMAEAYRQVGALYHRMSGPILRRIQLYEQARALPREEDRERIKKETGLENDDAFEHAKFQHEMFLQQAVKLTRQAVVISERVNGIDSPETLRAYSELAIFEHAIGNVELALRLLQHTVALSNAIYGDNHPEKARAAVSAAFLFLDKSLS